MAAEFRGVIVCLKAELLDGVRVRSDVSYQRVWVFMKTTIQHKRRGVAAPPTRGDLQGLRPRCRLIEAAGSAESAGRQLHQLEDIAAVER